MSTIFIVSLIFIGVDIDTLLVYPSVGCEYKVGASNTCGVQNACVSFLLPLLGKILPESNRNGSSFQSLALVGTQQLDMSILNLHLEVGPGFRDKDKESNASIPLSLDPPFYRMEKYRRCDCSQITSLLFDLSGV